MGAPVRVGDVLDGKYEVARHLGAGGMGVVVAARHRALDKLVALKFMHPEIAADAQLLDRFLREARAAARLSSEHVGRVLDVGSLGEAVPYIVMEYLEGEDLASVLAAHGPRPIADVCEYVLQACEAMVEAHAAGIVHRDLKPANLFLTIRPDGRPLIKVVDFGVSKALYLNSPTGTHAVLGTPAYMSPEQIRSARTVDARTDIWSLGICLYQLLAGRVPFDAESSTVVMLKVMQDPLPRLADARPDVPPGLAAVVERCLAKDREQRFETVAELAHALMPFAPDRERAARSLIARVTGSGMAAAGDAGDGEGERAGDSVIPGVGPPRIGAARRWWTRLGFAAICAGVVVVVARGCG